MALPFSAQAHRNNGVTLWLDTPGATVNVLNAEAAGQLDRWMDAWERARTPPRWVVIRSRKPDSFINGAGLLMASTFKTVQKAKTLTAPVRATYDRWAQLKIPTLAWIEGNCFGCGLEFAVACGYRVARPSAQTLFRMTELSDYRFIPLFGGTYRLPRLIGAEAAAALLLGGEIWDTEQALSRGLIHQRVSGELSDSGDVEALVEQLIHQEENRRPAPGSRRRRVPSRYWTQSPPTRRQLYQLCATLLERGWQGSLLQASRREMTAFATSVTRPAAQNAMRYFFVRHMARARMLGTSQRRQGKHVLRVGQQIQILFPLGKQPPTVCEVRARQDGTSLIETLRTLDYQGYTVVPSFGKGPAASQRLLGRIESVCRTFLKAGFAPASLASEFWKQGFETPLRMLWPALPSEGRGRRRRGRNARPTEFIPVLLKHLVDECLSLLRDGTLAHPSHADVLASTMLGFPLERSSLLLDAEASGASAHISVRGLPKSAGVGQ